ncbi:MAG: hypothetical protein ABI539_10800 [Acidobacteriota bacterium]
MGVHVYRLFLLILVLAVSVTGILAGTEGKKKISAGAPLRIQIQPWGRSQKDVDTARSMADKSPALRQVLDGSVYKFISVDFPDAQDGARDLSTEFRAVYYDYTNARVVIAEGDIAGSKSVDVSTAKFQPAVSTDELIAAFAAVESDTKLGPLYKTKQIDISPAMPPFTVIGDSRIINLSMKTLDNFSVIGVDLKDGRVVNYEGGAPPMSKAAPEACGIQGSGQATTSNGTPGQALLTIFQGVNKLWEMTVTRPSASSGNPTERSGIELQDVKYKSKLMLKRAHVPLLNVQYSGDFCGPYRDWQWQEGSFVAPDAGSTELVPGIRVLADGQVATTALDTGNDTGNFRGVAIYKQTTENGEEIVLVSEMNAGWYRYIMEWRFAPDGTVRPRYGFGGVDNACVCAVHFHHAYWRFDFDVVSSNNRVYQVEQGKKFLAPIRTEAKISRNYGTNRSILVQFGGGDEAVQVIPNLTDGVADQFGLGDFWILKYQNSGGFPLEIDDPNPPGDEIGYLDQWVNGESIDNTDVVVWYAAHFTHNDGGNLLDPSRRPNVLTGSHVVGPDIRAIRW